MQRFGLLIGLLALMAIAAQAADLKVEVINRHHMVSLSSFADKFGAVVDYDSEREGISMKLGDRTVDMIPYNRTAWVNGVAVTLDQPVVIVDDVTYLPLRFMCETYGLGYTCNDADSQVVVVDSYTHESCFFVVDWGWSRCDHVWCYDFDCRGYHNWCNDHNVCIAIHAGGPGYVGHPNGGFGVGVHNVGGNFMHNTGANAWGQHFAQANHSAFGAHSTYGAAAGHQGFTSHAPWYQAKSSQHSSWENRGSHSQSTSHSGGFTGGSSHGGSGGHDK